MKPGERRRLGIRGKGFKFERDPEVNAFIDQHIFEMTYAELRAACIERFGVERSPTVSSLSLYWKSRGELLLDAE